METAGATTELLKALTAASASGAALQAEDLEATLIEDLYTLNPLVALLPRKQATARVHEIARRTARQAAAFEGEMAKKAAPGQSTYDRPTVTLKIIDYWGSVTGFQQQASRKFFDSLLMEQQAGVESMAESLEFGVLWGASGTPGENVLSGGGPVAGDPYQFNGFDRSIVTNHIDWNAAVSLGLLDSMIDAASGFRGAAQDEKILITSIGMKSKISGLQTLMRRNSPDVEFEGGFRMSTYRNIPILETDYVKPAATAPASPAASVVAGGTLAVTTFHYRIASVRRTGEQVAGASVNATTAGGNLTVRLTWTADPNAILYKIFRGSSAVNQVLLAVIPAWAYDAEGNPTTSIATFDDTGAYTAPVAAQNPLDTGDETLFLINRNELRGCSLVGMIDPLGQPRENYMAYIPLAVTRATYDFMIRCITALQVPWEKLHATARRVSLT